MSQNIFDTIIPTSTSGNQLATILNNFKNAIVSGISGTSRPSTLQAGGAWIDTTNDGDGTWDYKVYDGTQDIVVFTLNKNTGLASVSSADNLLRVARVSDDSIGPILELLKKRDDATGQTQVGDILGILRFNGTRDDGEAVTQARLRSLTTNNTTASQAGASLIFELIPTNGSSLSEVMRIVDSRVAIGTTVPVAKLHVAGNAIRGEKESDDAVGFNVDIRKGRIAGSEQVLEDDGIGAINFISTDDTGAEIGSAGIIVSAVEDQTTTAQGSKVVIQNKKAGATTFTEQIVIEDDVYIEELRVNKLNATETELGIITEITDASILLNKGGTQAGANTAKAGFEVDMSDATNARVGYDSSKASRFVVGDVGDEKEIVDVSSTQTITNKNIKSPTRAGVKEGIESDLTTYATTADNAQWCFATDTKVMYQVIDGELVPAGSGGGGSSLVWEKAGDLSPTTEYIDGFHLENFSYEDEQEIYCFITVPSGYRAGKPIKLLNGALFIDNNTGNVSLKSDTALLKVGTTILGTYSDIHTSTNAEITVPATVNTLAAIGDVDLTDGVGEINGEAVSAGDMLRVRLYRDIADETASSEDFAKVLINSFELSLS